MTTFQNRTLIQSVGFGSDKIYIELNSGRVLSVPYTYTKKLSTASVDELKDYKLIANGMGIHFEQIDEDILLKALSKTL